MSLKKKVVWLPYDMDTAIGINNDGELVFDYQLEDIDYQRSGAPIFNGQDSVIWKNIRAAFSEELKTMYQNLRSSGTLSYEKVEQMFEAHQSKWSESIYNEDAHFKYIVPFVQDNANYLYMLLGSKAEQRKWWLYNRFRYIDSKYIAGDARSDSIFLRPYAPANITLTPYADIYATIAWDATITQERASRNVAITLNCPYQAMNGNIVTIYSSSQLALIGDLSPLQIGQIDISNATRLQALKVGSSASNYDNSNLYSLTFGSNVLMRVIDVRNCSGLGDTSLQGHTQTTVDISGCGIVEEVYFDGTKIQGVSLPNGGVLRVLHLPSTITNLTILNQKNITDLSVPNYGNITTLRLENVPTVNTKTIFNAIPINTRVRLIGFTWEATDSTEIEALLDRFDSMRGLDESGNNMEKAQISGVIHTGSLTGSQIASYNERYPYLTITADHTTSVLTYKTYDGSTTIATETIYDGGNGTRVNDISRPADSRYTYTPNGWSKVANGSPDANALVNVVADRTVYAAYDAEGQKYTVRFYNGSTLLKTVNDVLYGGTALYDGETPVHTTDPDNNEFIGWSPSNENITANTDCYAQYTFTGIVARKLIDKSLTGSYTNNRVTSIGINAFVSCSYLTTANFPAVTSIGDNAFQNGYALTTANFPVATSIGRYAFYNCSKLTTADFPVVTSIGDNAFMYCSKLTTADFPAVTSVSDHAFYSCSALTTVNFPVATSISNTAFDGCNALKTADFPSATSIGGNAFNGCSALTKLILRNTEQVATLANTSAFTNANNCIIYVPDALVDSYKSATNWSTYADRIKGLSELPTD